MPKFCVTITPENDPEGPFQHTVEASTTSEACMMVLELFKTVPRVCDDTCWNITVDKIED